MGARGRAAGRAAFGLLVFCAAAAAAQSDGQWSSGQDAVERFRAEIVRIEINGMRVNTIPASASVERRPPAPPGAGLVVDATEIGFGKFLRYDNARHPYPPGAWTDHIPPSGDLSKTPIVSDDADGAVSIQFSNLEELLRAVVSAARRRGQRVAVLNILAHGFPGAAMYPKDRAQQDGDMCSDWRALATGPDDAEANAPFPAKDDLLTLRELASDTDDDMGDSACFTGAKGWTEVVARIPEIRDAFSDDAQIHMQSCLLGLGAAGEQFTRTVAELLLSGGKGNVLTALSPGLVDWSLPEGMAFWDYADDAQYARDKKMSLTPGFKDRDFMRKGSIRVASYSDGRWITTVVPGQSFMPYGRTPLSLAGASPSR